MNAPTDTPRALPGFWREFGTGPLLLRLAAPATTPGMVLVAPAGRDWQRRPELRCQCWPQDLAPARWVQPGRAVVLRAQVRRLKPIKRTKGAAGP